MARKHKTNSTTSTILFFLVVGFFSLFSKHESQILSILKLLVTLVVICFLAKYAIKLISFIIRTSTGAVNSRLHKNAISKDAISFVSSIEKHLNVLHRKRSTLIISDDYGYKDSSRWEVEKINFARKFNHHSKNGVFSENLSEEYMSRLIDYAIDNYTPTEINSVRYSSSLTPYEYECYCASVLNQHGWEAHATKGSGDQGVDVIARKGNYKVAIQCKKYTSKVGNSAVQEVSSGMMHYGANHSVVVTNSSYTRSAKELANSNGVILIHHNDLMRLEELIIKKE